MVNITYLQLIINDIYGNNYFVEKWGTITPFKTFHNFD
jgi:hypothetical protein